MTERRKRVKEIQYPLLNEAAGHLKDEFWKNLFMDMARGKHPRKLHIDDKSVNCTKKNSFTYMYRDKSPVEIATELKQHISKALCIYSSKDMQDKEEQKSAINNEFDLACTEDSWKKIKSKKMREYLISKYVLENKERHSLSWDKTRLLYNMILDAFYFFHTHKSVDVQMEDSVITNIEDFQITPTIKNLRLDTLVEKQQHTSKIDLIHEWQKYTTNMYRKIETQNTPQTETQDEQEIE
jgi:hypothetical protein